MATPDFQYEVTPQGVHVAAGLLRRRGDEEDFGRGRITSSFPALTSSYCSACNTSAERVTHRTISKKTRENIGRLLKGIFFSVKVPARPVPELPGDRNPQSTLRRGWMFGGEAFREGLIKRLDKLKGGAEAKLRRRSGYTGVQTKDHGEAAALRLVTLGLHLVDWRRRI